MTCELHNKETNNSYSKPILKTNKTNKIIFEPTSSRSEDAVTLGQWHELRVSRTGRLAVMQVDKRPSSQVLAPGAFTQLSLPLNLYIGGVPNFDMVSPKVKVRTSFVGCIQKVSFKIMV